MRAIQTIFGCVLLIGIRGLAASSFDSTQVAPSTSPSKSGIVQEPLLQAPETRLILASKSSTLNHSLHFRGGGWLIPAGWNPLGYRITSLGEEFLSYEGSLDSDVGRFLASVKSGRKSFQTIKEQWLEVLRVSKTGQSMRIYKQLQTLLQFCLKAGLID